MKSIKLLRLLIAFLFVSLIHPAHAKEPKVTYGGGDGSTIEKAIIVKAPGEEAGVHAEYGYLKKHYPGYKCNSQATQNDKGKIYDVLQITTADGKKLSVYFDITAFYGK